VGCAISNGAMSVDYFAATGEYLGKWLTIRRRRS